MNATSGSSRVYFVLSCDNVSTGHFASYQDLVKISHNSVIKSMHSNQNDVYIYSHLRTTKSLGIGYFDEKLHMELNSCECLVHLKNLTSCYT